MNPFCNVAADYIAVLSIDKLANHKKRNTYPEVMELNMEHMQKQNQRTRKPAS